jgi:endonuclease/exonuclease/phosphatase family metal-dependent hydrolase
MCLAVVAMLLVLASITPTQVKGPGNERDRDAHVKENSTLFESGEASKLRTPPPAGEFRVVSYNIRWRSGDDLRELIKLFREDAEIGNANVLALQEVDRNKKRSGKTNTARLLADELGLYYAWAAPPPAKPNEEEETGVALLSVHPLTKINRIVLPNEGPNHRRRVALGASIQMGDLEVRVYSAHAETRISMEKKLEQMNALLLDLKQHAPNSPAVIMGDLNTWQPGAGRKTIKLFTDAGLTTPFGSQKTFLRKIFFVPIHLRLDWIWLRGLEPTGFGIDRKITISDHFPLWATLKISHR